MSIKLLNFLKRSQPLCVMNKRFLSLENTKKIKVNSIDINYLKVGNGPKTLLLLPGALGSIFTDFKPQVENLDYEKYTIVAWDPPGYGLSRPPDRDFSSGFFYRDAEYAVMLMKALNINKYSLVGWSDGGITALIAASKAIDQVQSVIVWGSNAYVTEKDIKLYENIRDIQKWSPRMKQPFIDLYGEKYFSETWSAWVDAFQEILKENNGDICCEALSKIQAPTFILHGAQDPLVPMEHPIYLHKNIKYGSLEIFPNGKHNIHLRYTEEFNAAIDKFLAITQ
ncbi:valacyclovir hydrolase-like isoform X2 [Adelges cooleyi]|uniref:valacyclovir hydrolase-like isoform X2 n=1 Tax=Adelges cooleyi TaxID=133065 RepID=UPI0021805026|nr:valacyclovir hydrolase-like isoform X2 [Adelges cooleyi]XP_050440354.1 valacyclovir hydrolase-like isoform X2 [Adelges cooleyi]